MTLGKGLAPLTSHLQRQMASVGWAEPVTETVLVSVWVTV